MSDVDTRLKRERPRVSRMVTALIVTCVATGTLAARAPVAAAASSPAPRTPNAGLIPFAADVLTLDPAGNLIAINSLSTPLSAPLFNGAGDPLNVTSGQFSSASATSLAKTVTKQGVVYTDFRISLTGLIAQGVYSLFYVTFNPNSANPVCGSTGSLDSLVALTARHPKRQQPDADSFIADSSGGALFHARVAGDLLAAPDVLIDVIYHFDGHTYGPVPTAGEAVYSCVETFGTDALRQLTIVQVDS